MEEVTHYRGRLTPGRNKLLKITGASNERKQQLLSDLESAEYFIDDGYPRIVFLVWEGDELTAKVDIPGSWSAENSPFFLIYNLSTDLWKNMHSVNSRKHLPSGLYRLTCGEAHCYKCNKTGPREGFTESFGYVGCNMALFKMGAHVYIMNRGKLVRITSRSNILYAFTKCLTPLFLSRQVICSARSATKRLNRITRSSSE